jgi:tyrosyl-tRNA synthetase
MDILDDLKARGLVHDVTDEADLRALLAAGGVTYYCGYDPTAVSLHAGNLVPLSVMTRLARAGHKMIAVVGGATGVVGDPSGRSEERKLLGPEELAKNLAAIAAQVRRFVSADAALVDNASWFRPIGFLDFLRDVGKHVTVNYMLAKESVRARLEDRDQGISFTEFSYMLLQGYDYAHLAKEHGCRLQIGGADQWGNITCGIELARKMHGPTFPKLYGLVSPLLLTADGRKFGKSVGGGAVWLDATMTSPYRFYQYWLNADDRDVEKFLKMFTFVPLDEIAAVVTAHAADPGKRSAQRRLAAEVTTWVHGEDQTRRVEAASQVMFGGSLAALTDADLAPLVDDLPSTTLPKADLEAGLPVLDLFVRTKLADSKGAARRLLQQGGVYVNNQRVTAEDHRVELKDLQTETMILLRAGKKSYHLLKVG